MEVLIRHVVGKFFSKRIRKTPCLLETSEYLSMIFYFLQEDGESRAEIVKSNRDETIEESTKLVPDENEKEIPKTGGFVKPNEHKPWHEKYTRAFSILIPWNRTSK